MYAPVRSTAPAVLPISRDEAKSACRVDTTNTDEDDLIDGLIEAATSLLDGWSGILGRCLVTQSWQALADDFEQCMRLPLPAATITSVKVRNAAGQLSTVTSTNYALRRDLRGSYVRFADAYSWPTDLAETQAVTIEFTAGYGAAEDVPSAIRQAIYLLVAHWYANREAVMVDSVAELPLGVKALLAPFSLKTV
jgi:uncharacterized phiE125 gp8 family phage protein